MSKPRIINIILVVVLVGVVIYLFQNFGIDAVSSELQKHSILGAVLYFLFMTMSVVIVAVPAVPLWPLALLTFGLVPSILITTLAINSGALISFYIGRRWGRKKVEKIIGSHAVAKVEHMFGINNPMTFFVLRILGNNAFDLISYLGGLSKLSIYWYGFITFIASVFWISVSFILIEKVFEVNSAIVYVGTVISYLIALGIGVVIIERLLKRKVR